ncbi:MAG: SDR family NAD(P)-dependent oxidoreductase [Clostridia bacterium]|nr:SDR family NAD(P)-dependent oxidoreductase [Clostridia bacterium]
MRDQIVLDFDHPMIKNHKVYNQNLLPGMAYIDMIYQLFREYGYDYTRLELRNLSFYNPLVVGKDFSIILDVQCTEIKKGHWQVKVEGQEQRNEDTDLVKKLYITAEIHEGEPVRFDETLDLDSMRQSARKVTSMEKYYRQCLSHDLVHTGFMKAEGNVYDMGSELLADISIGPNAASSSSDFMFHPTLIDGGGVSSEGLFSEGEKRLFLPLFYESFRASSLFQKHCITLIRPSSMKRKKDITYLTMEFYDENGRKIAELKNLIFKLVRETGLINPDLKENTMPGKESRTLAVQKPVFQRGQNGTETGTAGTSPVKTAQKLLKQIISELLLMPVNEIESDMGYYEMGLDSPKLLEVVKVIEKMLSIQLSPTLLFEYATITELADYLSKTYPEKLSQDKTVIQPQDSHMQEKASMPEITVSQAEYAGKEPVLHEDVAVIGMAGRYPMARDLNEFWNNLLEGKDCITEIPESRWNWKEYGGIKSPTGRSISIWGGFIDDHDCFDPQFFHISPREAELMDPQERLFLETCWEAMEDAGYTPETLVFPKGPDKRRRVGVFAGVMHKDYSLVGAEALSRGQVFPLSLNYAQIANRVSYFCNFHGPSMVIDTVCSSSLTAVHMALESIRHGECEAAFAGGVNLSLHPNKYISYGLGGLHSSEGYCRAFGKGGDGYVSSEGVGAILLKPLSKAIQDRDHIYAVIKGSSINHGGTVSGIMVPSPVAQADMIVSCFEKTGINPRTISYVEAHGTGTSLGDPIEMQGLVKAFSHYTGDRQFCSIGSVKSNIGHPEAAAGITGIIKAVLQLYHRTLVTSLHSEELNPYIDFEQSPFYVQKKTEEWKQPVVLEDGRQISFPRRSGISSFGATGSNAHVLLEEYVKYPAAVTVKKDGPVIIPLSARNRERLNEYAKKLIRFLNGIHAAKNQASIKGDNTEGLHRTLKNRTVKILSQILHMEEEAFEGESDWGELGIQPFQIVKILEGLQEEFKVEINIRDINEVGSTDSFVANIINNNRAAFKPAHNVLCEGFDMEEEPDICLINQNIDIVNLAYTLQVGREAMEERVAFIVRDDQELINKLTAFAENMEPIEGCWQGQIKNNKDTIEAINEDPETRKLADEWIVEGSLEKVAQLWVKGYALDWNLLYGENKPERVSLPTYPFARERYWIPEGNIKRQHVFNESACLDMGKQDEKIQVVPEEKVQEPYELMTFEETWEEQALHELNKVDIKTLAVFSTDCKKRQEIADMVRDIDKSVELVFISQGPEYKRVSRQQYVISKSSRDTYEMAFNSIKKDYDNVDAMLYLWAQEDKDCIWDYSCIVYILQAITASKLKPARLLLAAHFDNWLERCYLESWIGFERSLGLVLPNVKVASVYMDYCGRSIETSIKEWMKLLWRELEAGSPQSVLYKNEKRFEYRMKQTEINKGGRILRKGGTYLITGGCGGLGFLFAEYLAKTQSANLILTGRSPMSEKIQSKINHLEGLGSKALYIQADVCDLNGMGKGLKLAEERYGKLHGVIHAAGVEAGKSVLEKEILSFQKILEPKIKGTLALDELLLDEKLDFVCYFSSSSAMLGDFGSCDYAVGNRFQMAYGEYRNHLHSGGQRHGKTVVINWPLWRDGGMSVGDEENTKMYLKSSGQNFLEASEGLDIFESLLTESKAQHLVLVGQPSRVKRFLGITGEKPGIPSYTVLACQDIRIHAGHGSKALEQCLEDDIKGIIAGLLKLQKEKLGKQTNFADFGFDSISLLEFAIKLTDYYGIEITPAVFFGCPTIEKLVQFFLKEHNAAVAGFYKEHSIEKNSEEINPAILKASDTKVLKTNEYPPVNDLGNTYEPIAVIGMSGRFPGADTAAQLWNNVRDGKSCITEIPENRWDWREYYGDHRQDEEKTNSKWGAFLSDVDRFDPLFFEISPKEAELMDPQQRLFLQEAWHAFEDAGYMGKRIRGMSCGVYVGVEESQYGSFNDQDGRINSNQNATLSARISYYLDLKGPNMALTAACSSGLVAVHQACQALHQEECEMALAGGISLLLSPMLYAGFSKADMLSSDGKCYVFDRRANGMVPGEAVAAILLKPLSKAIRDKDQIYGCIKASGVNYDGRTNGITAPNPFSQEDLVRKIYKKYNINPADIDYVLSHSIGSKLGDSIEIQALKKAFGTYSDNKQRSIIGSIKPLIGHTFAASGVVGLIVMLMAMKNNTIPSTHNYEACSELINFADSPFNICKENKPWNSRVGRARLGTVSTTGISGTNAHTVIEEYIGQAEADPENPAGPVLFVLSAKSMERLKAYAESILDFVESYEGLNMTKLAYTLQVGREAMDYRLAFLTCTKSELRNSLQGFINGNKQKEVLVSQLKREKNGISFLEADEDIGVLLQTWLQERKLDKLAERWVNGLDVDWEQLYGEDRPGCISLPVYPFRKDRYWKAGFKAVHPDSSAAGKETDHCLHPLLHSNTSSFYEQRFSSAFSGREFFLSEHMVKGQKVLPGAACLEMVRAAIEQSAGEKGAIISLQDIVWAKPVIAGKGALRVYIGLMPDQEGQISFEICSKPEAADAERIVYCQGSAICHKAEETAACDIQEIKNRFSQILASSDRFYEIFRQMGIEYGPGHKGVETIYAGSEDGCQNQVLVKLSLPPSVSGTLGNFVLHPSLLDSALQSVISFYIRPQSEGINNSIELILPFAMQEIEIYGGCSREMWALVKLYGSNGTGDGIRKYDIDMYDEAGRVCVRMKGFSTRVVGNSGDLIESPESRTYEEDKKYVEAKAGAVVSYEKVEDNKVLPELSQDSVMEKSVGYFMKLISSAIKLPVSQMEADAPMEKYGIDSLMVINLTKHLEKIFGSLSKTLFFEYYSIKSLTEYFVKNYRGQLVKILGIEDKAVLTEKPEYQGLGDTLPKPDSRKLRLMTGKASGEGRREKEESGALDIAVIGISGRYPGARNLKEFWTNLRDGRDSIVEIPKNRWNHELYFDKDRNRPGKTYSKWGGFLEGVDLFDSLFFNISPREVEKMDPQERLFLECVYETMEDAGYTRKTFGSHSGSGMGGNVGVYVGVMNEEYQFFGIQSQAQGGTLAVPGNPAAIANRVSYWCNFNGPSMAVDTMCSSSLTAIHLACRGIANGECEVAIAGGVNISIHPNKYLLLSQSNFVSSKGRCESFGQGGDGYVPGEGVGAVLLKPLWKAISDRDHIYGVIKGTSVNHGGKTNGFTVPNPNAQAGVIAQAFRKAGINPRTISYIEAHGTGTSLGDPIEITGLTKAFREYTKENRFCAIGSAKSNIGHCESAAGIAGVTKVLLQLKHRQLVPSLHAEVLNPNIDFSNTPFVVQSELSEWNRPVVEVNGEKREFPRIAGISSFGAGGSNAHVVIEEYIPEASGTTQTAAKTSNPAVIVLSARNRSQLLEQAKRLLSFIREEKIQDSSLADFAFTLQVGREEMEERLAFTAASFGEVERKLNSFIDTNDSNEEVYLGQVQHNNETIAVFTANEDLKEVIEKWTVQRKYDMLISLWVKGLQVNWDILYSKDKPHRISLPAYPFERERHWVPAAENTTEISTSLPSSALKTIHPLLHQNTSDLLEQKFSSVFSGNEFFLTDHIVKGVSVLPGVACLEMAGAAVLQAAGRLIEGHGKGFFLKDVVWIRPVTVGEGPVNIDIGLYPRNNGEIAYKIFNGESKDGAGEIIYNQGFAVLNEIGEARYVNLRELKEKCNRSSIPAEQCYKAYKSMGLDYGAGHRGIENIYLGNDQVLAKLSLPSSVSHTGNHFLFHPSLADSALQATIGLTMEVSEGIQPLPQPELPFTLQELKVYERFTDEMWAYIRYGDSSEKETGKRKFDIDICDSAGKVCAEIRGISPKRLEGEIQPVNSRKQNTSTDLNTVPVGNVMMLPVWDRFPLKKEEPFPLLTEQVLVIGGTDRERDAIRGFYKQICELDIETEDSTDTILHKLKACEEINHIVWISPYSEVKSLDEDRIIDEQDRGVMQLFRIVKAVLRLGYGEKKLGWTVITIQAQPILDTDSINPTHSGIHGLVGSLSKEYPGWMMRLVDTEAGSDLPVSDIFALPPDRQGRAWGCRNKNWYRQQLIPVQAARPVKRMYKEGGVYVIIGGAGGIGEEWSEYMICAYKAQIIWIGRREKDGAIQAKIDRLAAFGPAPVYIAADAASKESMMHAYEEIKRSYPRVNGVIHSAMVLSGQKLAVMGEEEFKASFMAKVAVSVRIAQVFNKEALDFVLFFSSIMSFAKAPGQSDYASGCVFKDAFAGWLSREWPCTVKVMNWGYWKSKDKCISGTEPQMVQTYRRLAEIGVGLIEPPEAMNALEILLAGYVDQIAFMKTTKSLTIEGMDSRELFVIDENGEIKRRQQLNGISQQKGISVNESGKQKLKGDCPGECFEEAADDFLKAGFVEYLKKTVSEVLKLPVNRIKQYEAFEKYGIDSIIGVQLSNKLGEVLEDINNTLFFEFQTIEAVAGHFVKTRKDSLISLLGLRGREPEEGSSCEDELSSGLLKKEYGEFSGLRFIKPLSEGVKESQRLQASQEDIAIIAVSGRYPKANTLEEFWNNLKTGMDCITEVPEDRWDTSTYFDEDRNRSGRTYCKWGGFIDGVDEFDPLFFNMSPREAEVTDPQERLFLECVWNLLESAGYTREAIRSIYEGRVGVYAGAMYQQYQALDSDIDRESVVSLASYSSIANRVSYYFNLNGPSIAVDTACSSSATAIHMACESLHKGDCKLAIAGGVNLSIHPKKYLGLSRLQLIGSHDGSRSFGDGDGYIPAEGVGAVLLKPLSEALKDKDPILAVIKSTAVNHGGRSNGYSVPNLNAQAQLIEDNFKKSEIDPRTVSYVEAAAAGSALGDPIEVAALTKAFRKFTEETGFCAIGTVKSNIGHAEAASGISQLTKVILQMQHKKLVPAIKINSLNPNINFDRTPFYLTHSVQEWKRPRIKRGGEEQEYPRRAVISSFGAGGSNTHLIVEEFIPEHVEEKTSPVTHTQIVVFSARNTDRLQAVVRQMLEYVEKRPELLLADLAYTLQTGREEMEFRLALVVNTQKELIDGMKTYLNQNGKDVETQSPVVCFTGDTEREYRIFENAPDGGSDDNTVSKLLKETNLKELALYWVKGGKVPWQQLHEGNSVRKIPLPTYPFARERCWITGSTGEYGRNDTAPAPVENKWEIQAEAAGDADSNVKDYITRFLALELKVDRSKIKVDRNIHDYGVNSITAMKLIRSIEETYHVQVTGREIIKHTTVKSLAGYITERLKGAENGNAPDRTGVTGKEYSDKDIMQILEEFKLGTLSLEEAKELV